LKFVETGSFPQPGANNEGARSDTASHGKENHLVASRRDSRDQQPNDAAMEVEALFTSELKSEKSRGISGIGAAELGF